MTPVEQVPYVSGWCEQGWCQRPDGPTCAGEYAGHRCTHECHRSDET